MYMLLLPELFAELHFSKISQLNTSFALEKLFAHLNFMGERASAKINTPRKLIVVKVNENSLNKLIARRRADPTKSDQKLLNSSTGMNSCHKLSYHISTHTHKEY